MECSEKYCVSCFMSFHQKGALKKHSTQSIEQVCDKWIRGLVSNETVVLLWWGLKTNVWFINVVDNLR